MSRNVFITTLSVFCCMQVISSLGLVLQKIRYLVLYFSVMIWTFLTNGQNKEKVTNIIYIYVAYKKSKLLLEGGAIISNAPPQLPH